MGDFISTRVSRPRMYFPQSGQSRGIDNIPDSNVIGLLVGPKSFFKSTIEGSPLLWSSRITCVSSRSDQRHGPCGLLGLGCKRSKKTKKNPQENNRCPTKGNARHGICILPRSSQLSSDLPFFQGIRRIRRRRSLNLHRSIWVSIGRRCPGPHPPALCAFYPTSILLPKDHTPL